MNIGLKYVKKFNILFLNSGDIFFDKYCVKNIYEEITKNPKKILIFKVILKYKKTFYYPKKNYFLSKEYLPHPGFIRPQVNNKNKLIKFDEKFETIADGLWMKKNLNFFRKKMINKNLVIHSLGGISTVPTLRLVNEKKRLSLISFIKELIKLIIFSIISNNIYYRIINFKKFHIDVFKKK
jgi:hypothetical protein